MSTETKARIEISSGGQYENELELISSWGNASIKLVIYIAWCELPFYLNHSIHVKKKKNSSVNTSQAQYPAVSKRHIA